MLIDYGRTDDGPQSYRYTISSLGAFGSGELKINHVVQEL